MPLNILRLIPAAISLLVIAYIAGHIVGTDDANNDWKAKWSDETARHASALAAATEAARASERALQTNMEQLQHDAQQRIDAAQADAAAANDESRRLQRAANELAHRAGGACQSTGSAASRQTGPAAAVVLADLLGRIDAIAGELAAATDRANAAGLACQRAYAAAKGGGQ